MFFDITGAGARTPGEICALKFYVYSKNCASRCNDIDSRFSLFAYEARGLQVEDRVPFAAAF